MAHQILTELADRGVRPVQPRSFRPRQQKDSQGSWRKKVVPPDSTLSVQEILQQNYSQDISKIDKRSQRLHCRCGHIFSLNLRNLETVFDAHVNGKVCKQARRGMQIHTLFHFWGGPTPGPARPPPKIPDPNALCRGVWEDNIRGMDLTKLYGSGGNNNSFYPVPRARFQYEKDGIKVQVVGTIRSVACMGYCVDVDGLPRKNWRCEACNKLITSREIRNR